MLVVGILYLNQFRDGLIEARVESLMTQGEIIAGAIAASATVETEFDQHRSREAAGAAGGRKPGPGSDQLDSLDFPINPERVAPVLRRLISPTRTRARIYDRDANLLLDSRHLYSRGQILRFDLPPVDEEEIGVLDRLEKLVVRASSAHRPAGLQGAARRQWRGFPGSDERADRRAARRSCAISEQGEQIVSVAVPIQRFRAVLGVLMLSTQGGDIDKIVAAERSAILRVFGVAALVNGGPVASCWPRPSPIRCAGCRRRPSACAAASRAARRFPISPTARTRSAISRWRCAT